MRILSCNIRNSSMEDGDNNWIHRKDQCLDLIESLKPDIIGFQEVVGPQYQDIIDRFPGFGFYGLPDEIGASISPELIFYRKDKFNLVSQAGYWLSETPHIPGSRSWGTACIRIANWMILEEKESGKHLRVVNTHLDHVSDPARVGQGKLINSDAGAYPEDMPQILTGDMNCDLESGTIRTFLKGGWEDSFESTTGKPNNEKTYHEFKGPDFNSEYGRIDWIFHRGDLKPEKTEIISGENNGRYPSDHYFLKFDFSL